MIALRILEWLAIGYLEPAVLCWALAIIWPGNLKWWGRAIAGPLWPIIIWAAWKELQRLNK